MPKVALTQIDKFADMLECNLRLVKGAKTDKKMAEMMGVKTTTANNRVHNPLQMRLEELFYLCSKSHVDIGDFVSKKLEIG